MRAAHERDSAGRKAQFNLSSVDLGLSGRGVLPSGVDGDLRDIQLLIGLGSLIFGSRDLRLRRLKRRQLGFSS